MTFSKDDSNINEIVKLAKTNDYCAFEWLTQKYKSYITTRIYVKKYFLPGGDNDDLIQEGLIGLSKAVMDFDEQKGTFDAFAKTCIDRQMISAIKTATRKKNRPLNERVPIERPLNDNENVNVIDLYGNRDSVQYSLDFDYISPDQQFILKQIYEMQEKILRQSLSPNEKQIFDLYLEGKMYKEIMEELGIEKQKRVDNAIQRVRKKLALIRQNLMSSPEQYHKE